MKVFGKVLRFLVLTLFLFPGFSKSQALEKTVTLTEAGTISSFINSDEKWEITDLTVVGPINGTDILFIREMLGRDKYCSETKGKVTTLDLSEANIVAGGASYVYTNNFTEDDVIGDNMFAECDKLQKMVLPNSTKVLGVCSFYRCYELKEINIPEYVEEINSNSFFMDSSLTDLFIPASVNFIDYAVFCGCTSMVSFNVDPENQNYKSVDGVLYDKRGEVILAFPSGITGEYTVPLGVVRIAPAAFNICSLSKINISEGVEILGDGSFSNSPFIEFISFPNTLKVIEEGSFVWCDKLSEIVWGDSLEEIGDHAFVACNSLKEVVLPESLIILGNSAFANCDNLESVYIGSNVEYIGTDVFITDKSLVNLEISENNEFFSSYENVIFNKDFTCLIKCPEGIYGDFEVLDSVTEIEEEAFYNCDLITGISMKNVNVIKPSAFSGCKSMKFADLGESLEELPPYLMESCVNLESVTYGNKIKTIGANAFISCISLKKVYFPTTLEFIDYDAFSYCNSLEQIFAYGDVPPKCPGVKEVFSNVKTNQVDLYVPENYLELYLSNSVWNKFNLCSLEEEGVENLEKEFNDKEFVTIYSLSGTLVYSGLKDNIKNLPMGTYLIVSKSGNKSIKYINK